MFLKGRIVCLSALVSLSAAAKPILVLPIPGLLGQEPIFHSYNRLGQPGVSVNSRYETDGPSPPSVQLMGVFPLKRQPNVRERGWSWGARAGVTRSQFIEEKSLSPGQYFWEVAVGRGSMEIMGSDPSGLRGYMELSLRNDRPQLSDEVRDVADSLGIEFPEHRLMLGLKIGAATSLTGAGLVEQKIPSWIFRSFAQAYVPVESRGSFLSVQIETLHRCFFDQLACGFLIGAERTYESRQGAGWEELGDLARGGLIVNWISTPLWEAHLSAAWETVLNKHIMTTQSWPVFAFTLTRAF